MAGVRREGKDGENNVQGRWGGLGMKAERGGEAGALVNPCRLRNATQTHSEFGAKRLQKNYNTPLGFHAGGSRDPRRIRVGYA